MTITRHTLTNNMFSRTANVVAVATVLAAAATVVVADDHCNAFPTCSACVASPKCGWCSAPVDYKPGAKGFHCAGFGGSGNQFAGNGVHPTETGERAY